MSADRQKSIHWQRESLPLFASSGRVKMPKPTADKPLIISASELRDFLRCRVKWYWRYGAKIEPKQGGIALEFGSVVHAILELWYARPPEKRTRKGMERDTKRVIGKTTPRELKDTDFELITAMMAGYAVWVKDLDKKAGLVECIPELSFDLPLVKDKSIRVRGRIDTVFKSTTKKKTMGSREFKSKKSIDRNVTDTTLQNTVYLWALRQLYPKHREYQSYHTQLRKQIPSDRVSAPLFDQQIITRTDDEIDQWAIDTARAAMDMLDAAIYPTPDDTCSWQCDYQIPCLLRGKPADVEHVLTTAFQPKVYRP